MKSAIVALLASVAVAQEAPLPDQSVATELVYEFNVASAADSQITQLTESSNPPKPESVGVAGTVTASTDAEGAGSISIDLTGYWGAKFQNSNSYKDIVCNMGIEFRQQVTETTTETQTETQTVENEDGTTTEQDVEVEVEVTNTVTKAETVVITGSRVGNNEVEARTKVWNTSGLDFTSDWDYETTLGEELDDDSLQLDNWTGLAGSFIDNDGSGSSKTWLGFTLSGSRPFEGPVVNFENGGNTIVTASTWVTKKGNREYNRGSLNYVVDLAVPEPEPVEPEVVDPVDNTTVDDGASALSAAAAAAVAVLALTF